MYNYIYIISFFQEHCRYFRISWAGDSRGFGQEKLYNRWMESQSSAYLECKTAQAGFCETHRF